MPSYDPSHPTPGVKLTYDDLADLPDDGLRHELLDGEHYVSPSPSVKHQSVVAALLAAIHAYLRAHPIGKVLTGPTDVVLSRSTLLVPDILFVTQARKGVLTAKNIQGAPDLVVEVGSPGTRRRDEQQKRELYERFGVSEYWVVDPDLDEIKVYCLREGRYERAVDLSLDRGDVLTTPLLPGLAMPLAEIFEE